MTPDKKTVRNRIRLLKSRLPEEARLRKSVFIWQQIEATERFRKAGTVLMYWSMPDEVPTHDFILHWCREKTIILPVVDGNILRLKQFHGKQALRKNTAMNLYEPQGDDYPAPHSIELAIVPGIAFDRGNHRMGRGKGYYDKLLPGLTAYKIGVGFDFQLLDHIPVTEYDIPVDEVIVG